MVRQCCVHISLHFSLRNMACFQKESPALKQILLKLYRADKAFEIDHHLYEFGSVHYHIQGSAKDRNQQVYLSISTPLLVQRDEAMLSYGLSDYTKRNVKTLCPQVVEIIEPPNEGYELTLQLNFTKINSKRKGLKSIAKISTVRAVIVTSEVKEMLKNTSTTKISQGAYKPIKLVYHPKEPFYLIRQPKGIKVVLPMRFKESSDWTIATTIFQELMDVGNLKAYSKVPQCCWAPVPPPELRGEPLEDLTTNGGFVSFDVSTLHLEGRKLDKTIWTLLNFYAYVKFHVKSTRGFIQRRMRSRLERLVEVLQIPAATGDGNVNNAQGGKCARKLISSPEPRAFQPRSDNLIRKIQKRLRFSFKIRGLLGRFRPKWLRIPSCFSARRYVKLD